MKKLSIITVTILSIISCNSKKEKKIASDKSNSTNKEQTLTTDTEEKKTSLESSFAIEKDSTGVYKQHFILEKGITYPFTTYQKDVINMTSPTGESQSVTSETTDNVTFTVNDIKDDIYDIQINFVSKKASQSTNGQNISIDTDTPAPKNEELKNKWTIDKALVNNSLQMKMDKTGKILSITGFENIYNKISSTLNKIKGATAEIKKQVLNSTKAGFNEKVLKDQFTKNIMILPEKGVKIGEQWSKSDIISPDGKIKLSTHYSIKSVENGLVTISVSGGIPKQSDKQTQQGVTRSISSELIQNGTITFNQKSGWIKQQKINVTATQTESVSDGKQSQSIKSVTSTTIAVNP